MLKKRLIFTLLYDKGYFVLSRNFRLQRVGTIDWLLKNYNFANITTAIDELVVLDVTRGERDFEAFTKMLKTLTRGCFMPISAGGGLIDIKQGQQLLRSGADKLVLNTSLFRNPHLITELAKSFGQQCLLGSIDCKSKGDGTYEIYTNNGQSKESPPLKEVLKILEELPLGELYINSMDRDGTGQGYDTNLIQQIPSNYPLPLIIAGGAGNYLHLSEGLKTPEINAAATAHLFNFVGDGLVSARKKLSELKIQLADFS